MYLLVEGLFSLTIINNRLLVKFFWNFSTIAPLFLIWIKYYRPWKKLLNSEWIFSILFHIHTLSSFHWIFAHFCKFIPHFLSSQSWTKFAIFWRTFFKLWEMPREMTRFFPIDLTSITPTCLHPPFTCEDPKSAKKTVKWLVILAHSGSARVKTACRMLMKLTLGHF